MKVVVLLCLVVFDSALSSLFGFLSNRNKEVKEDEENMMKIKKEYARKDGEQDVNYFNRICKKGEIPIEQYVQRMTLTRRAFPDLDLWFEDKYAEQIRVFYTQLYSRKPEESDDRYYCRLMTRETFETETNLARRADVLQYLFPKLSLWYEERWYKYSKPLYEIYYKPKPLENCLDYLKRVFEKVPGEDELNYYRQSKLIQKANPNSICWNENTLKKAGICFYIMQAKTEMELKKRVEEVSSGKSKMCQKTVFEIISGYIVNKFNIQWK